jgi:hypothetical protein
MAEISSVQESVLTRISQLAQRLRLLEAAGACEVMCALGGTRERSLDWWTLFADVNRAYRGALYERDWPGPAMSGLVVPRRSVETRDIEGAVHKAKGAARRWKEEVTGGEAYLAFVRAYAHFMNLDGERGVVEIRRSLEVSEQRSPLSADAADLLGRLRLQALGRGDRKRPMSSYAALQEAADYMTVLFDLPSHALSHVKNFAVVPDYLDRRSD